jgi:hypothetical protein
MIFRSRFVQCVPVRISPVAVRVAVHRWSATRARDEVSGVRQGMTKVGARLVPQGALRSLSSAGTVVVVRACCYSRLSKDYERIVQSSETFIEVAMRSTCCSQATGEKNLLSG